MCEPIVAIGPAQIEADRYSFSYDESESTQLNQISFTVEPRQKIAVMGATGAGKTTLLMSLNGLVPHHYEGMVSGVLMVLGHMVEQSRICDLVRTVGLVMQDSESQITGATVWDDVIVGPANLGLAKEEVISRARRALIAAGLEGLEYRDSSQLSGGQQQRLAMAGVLAMHPQLMLLDEPTSELDPLGAQEVISSLDQMWADGIIKTMIIASHDPEFVCEWADRLMVLDSGKLIYDGAPQEFFADPDTVRRVHLREPTALAALHRLECEGLIPRGCRSTSAEGIAEFLDAHLPMGSPAHQPETPAPQISTPTAISASEVTYRYPSGTWALNGITLDIGKGEFVALLGCNGAGKTTFAHHLNGLFQPTSGSIAIAGEPISGKPVHDLARSVGYVFQNPDHQIFAATVFDEIAFGLRNQGADDAQVRQRVEQTASRVGLARKLDLHPYRLSRGERQCLAVASMLVLGPNVLVIDEPTTGLDWAGSSAVMDLIRELNDAGHTVLIVTHDMTLAALYARRAIVFDEGRVIGDCQVDALFSDDDLLSKAHLRAPQVTRLARLLGLEPVHSVDDFAAAWKARQ